MKNSKEELVKVRLKKAEDRIAVTKLAAESKYWLLVAGNLYYACFYLVQALFAANNITTSTHAGTKSLFGSQFIKTQLFDERWSRLLARLFRYRQDADYADFSIITEEDIAPYIEEVIQFEIVVRNFIAQSKDQIND